MKIEALQAFVTAAECRSFSKAGEKLYMSQPTVSRYVSELEKQLGGALFMRNAHACELTLLGKQAFIHARRIMNEWESMEMLGRENAADSSAAMRIGYTYQKMLEILTPVLPEGGLAEKGVELSVRFGDGEDITRLVREGKLDCAVMHLPSVSNPAGLEIRVICKCSMGFHAPKGHYLAQYDAVKLEQLIHETDVRIRGEKGFYRTADEAFESLNLPQMKHIYVDQASDCMPITLYKNGICLNPSIYPPWPECKKVIIQDWTTDYSLVFVTRTGEMRENTEQLYRALCRKMKKEMDA